MKQQNHLFILLLVNKLLNNLVKTRRVPFLIYLDYKTVSHVPLKPDLFDLKINLA